MAAVMTHKLTYGHTPGETLPAHGGSSAVAKPGVTTRHNDGDYVPRRIRWAEGHGQDPAQDGARTPQMITRTDVLFGTHPTAPTGAAHVPAEPASGEEQPTPSLPSDRIREVIRETREHAALLLAYAQSLESLL